MKYKTNKIDNVKKMSGLIVIIVWLGFKFKLIFLCIFCLFVSFIELNGKLHSKLLITLSN